VVVFMQFPVVMNESMIAVGKQNKNRNTDMVERLETLTRHLPSLFCRAPKKNDGQEGTIRLDIKNGVRASKIDYFGIPAIRKSL
jgi:hypothetical protein